MKCHTFHLVDIGASHCIFNNPLYWHLKLNPNLGPNTLLAKRFHFQIFRSNPPEGSNTLFFKIYLEIECISNITIRAEKHRKTNGFAVFWYARRDSNPRLSP